MKKVILGATGSIGSSLAKKLVESGEQVHLVGRDETSLSELANELNSTFTTCDVLEDNFSDNYFDLRPNEQKVIRIKRDKFHSINSFKESLNFLTLYDTY